MKKIMMLITVVLLYATTFSQDLHTIDRNTSSLRTVDANGIVFISKGFFDTSGSAVDTVIRRIKTGTYNNLGQIFNRWYRFSVIADDTLQICTDANFAATDIIIVLPDIPYVSDKFSLPAIPRLYYKRYGTAGTVNVYFTINGN